MSFHYFNQLPNNLAAVSRGVLLVRQEWREHPIGDGEELNLKKHLLVLLQTIERSAASPRPHHRAERAFDAWVWRWHWPARSRGGRCIGRREVDDPASCQLICLNGFVTWKHR